MQKKPSPKEIYKKKNNKKISLKQLIFIILAIAVLLAFLLISIYTPKRNRPNHKEPTPLANPSPSFRKDGDLTIYLSQKNSEIKLDVEVVKNDEERMRGLMYRHYLPDSAGMLFIFPIEELRSFWMKDTFISLDIIYINSKKEIISIQKYTQPKSTYSIPSEKPARYVLEVNAGFSDKYGISTGDKIEFSN